MINKPDKISDLELKILLAKIHRLAVHHNLIEGVWNHISLESTQVENNIIFTPGHTHWDLIDQKNLAVLNDKGELVEGKKGPIYAAWMIHKPIHKLNKNYKCLIHIHSPYITSISINGFFETNLTQHSSIFYNDVIFFRKSLYVSILNNELWK